MQRRQPDKRLVLANGIESDQRFVHLIEKVARAGE